MENIGNSNPNFRSKNGQSFIMDQSIRECLNIKSGHEDSILFSTDDQLNQLRKENEKI